MGFFRLDGPFFKYGTILCDIIILSVLWCICSLPIITLGPATAALYYVTTRIISAREGYIVKDFFKSFTSNFIQSAAAGIFLTAAGGLLAFNAVHLKGENSFWSVIKVIQVVLFLELVITSFYIFPIIARFKMKLKDIFKMAFFMANRHFFTTLTCFLLFAATIFGLVFYSLLILPFIFLIPGLFAYITSFMIMLVFKKYAPEMDSDISVDGKNILEERHRIEKEAEKKAEKEKKEDNNGPMSST